MKYFQCQAQAIVSVFTCVGFGGALALCNEFMKQWGVRLMPWLEQPVFVVVQDIAMSCVTEDKSQLPVLELFAPWVARSEVCMRQDNRVLLAKMLVERCRECGFPGEQEESVAKFLQVYKPQASAPQAGEVDPDDEAEPEAEQDIGNGMMHDKEMDAGALAAIQATGPGDEASTSTHRIRGKRSVQAQPETLSPITGFSLTRKRTKTSPSSAAI